MKNKSKMEKDDPFEDYTSLMMPTSRTNHQLGWEKVWRQTDQSIKSLTREHSAYDRSTSLVKFTGICCTA